MNVVTDKRCNFEHVQGYLSSLEVYLRMDRRMYVEWWCRMIINSKVTSLGWLVKQFFKDEEL